MSDAVGKRINPKARLVILALVTIIGLIFIGIVTFAAFGERIFLWSINPKAPFETFTPPPEPDYAKSDSWAALPFTDDFADLRPEGTPKVLGAPPADVFFIHPTTYYSAAGWNGPIDDPMAKSRVDEGVMKHQASAFNACCRVFAPRYRQATLYYGVAQNEDSWRAMALAYSDIERAFEHYLDQWAEDRPLIIAAHSQGSRHLIRFLQERVANNPALRARLVAVYAVGAGFPMALLGDSATGLEPCTSALQTGCVISWTTIAAGGSDIRYQEQHYWTPEGYKLIGEAPRLCTNPVTWTTGKEKASKNFHLGAVPYTAGLEPLAAPIPGLIEAQCKDGMLTINRPEDGFSARVMAGGDYHIYDYNLFYMDVRKNAVDRVEAFLAAR